MLKHHASRVLAALFALCVVCTVHALPASAAEIASGTCGDNLTWTLDDTGTLTISGTGEMEDSAPWLDNSDSITSVVIESGVTTIGEYAFEDCEGLTSVTIGNSVTSIGYGAFEGCTSLTSVTIPDSVTFIGGSAFYGCTSLTEVIVDANNPNYSAVNGVLFDKDQTTLIRYPAGKPGAAYMIPDSVTSIGYGAFSRCTSLTAVTIGNGVTSIGYGAFYGCSLTDVYYGGNETQWNAIAIGNGNDPLVNATIHYNSDGPAPAYTWTVGGVTASGGQIAVQLTDNGGSGGVVYTAAYAQSGQMLRCAETDAAGGSVTLDLDTSGADSVRVFVLDPDTMTPVSLKFTKKL